MWFEFEDLNEISELFACSLGKALALAQSYEENCKYVLLILNLDVKAGAGGVKTLSEIKAYSEKLLDGLMLGEAIKQLRNHEISGHEIDVLVKGKLARNFFAHESAHPMLLGRKSVEAIIDIMPEFKSHVVHLGRAENLVSQWSYMIQEKCAPPARLVDEYPERVVEWILSDIAPLMHCDDNSK